MSLSLSRLAMSLSPSATLALNATIAQLKSEGVPVISLGAGEPDFATPAHICQSAIEAIERGCTRYTDVSGIAQLRQAICRHIQKQKGLFYTPNQVIVGSGAKQVLFDALQAILDPGDEVILPIPYWVSYPDMIRMAGGTPVFVDTSAASGFLPTYAQLAGAITSRTKALIINTPNNPSGAVWPRTLIHAAMELAQSHDFYVISDEIYESLLYGEAEHFSPAAASDDAFQRTIVISGFSKAYAMTGWRMGYATGPQSVISAMTALQSHATGNANSIAQYAALSALEGSQTCVQQMTDVFAQRRKLLLHCLDNEQLKPAVIPQGAFYLLLDVGRIMPDDIAFSAALLQHAHVAVVPGTSFGAKGCVRISYAVHESAIAEAIKRIGSFVRQLK